MAWQLHMPMEAGDCVREEKHCHTCFLGVASSPKCEPLLLRALAGQKEVTVSWGMPGQQL